MSGARLRWAQQLLMSFQQIAAGAPADAGRELSAAPDRKAQVKYDDDVLHIIKQYPGCNDAGVLAFLRARVRWFGRGTLIHKLFRPSLGVVHAAGHRLEIAGKIKTKVDHSQQQQQMLRFYPNNPLWADAGAGTWIRRYRFADKDYARVNGERVPIPSEPNVP